LNDFLPTWQHIFFNGHKIAREGLDPELIDLLNPDPLFRTTDPQIRVWNLEKYLWIRNTAWKFYG